MNDIWTIVFMTSSSQSSSLFQNDPTVDADDDDDADNHNDGTSTIEYTINKMYFSLRFCCKE